MKQRSRNPSGERRTDPRPARGACSKGISALSLFLALAVWICEPAQLRAEQAKSPAASAAAHAEIAQGRAGLPRPVAEMHDAILSAARSGRVEELWIPVRWNELPPDFGDLSVKDTIAVWRKNSPLGSGREWLALLIDVLDAPYAVVHSGPDVENARVFIWPAFAELPLDKLSPPLEVEFLRLVPANEAARMKKLGRYDGYAIAIGADGTWHAFKKVPPPRKSPLPGTTKAK